MKKCRREDESVLSLDSFLDIVTNVVGVLILVAVVTVLSAGDIAISSGATSLRAPRVSAARLLVECARGELFFVDEEANSQRARELIAGWSSDDSEAMSAEVLLGLFNDNDIGDASYRVRAETHEQGVAWVYRLRPDARGDTTRDFEKKRADFIDLVEALPTGSFVYFVVHDDSFDVFREAQGVAKSRGIATGWHPVEGATPIRISSIGSLGKRVQ